MKGIEYLESPSVEYTSLTPSRAASPELNLPGFRLLDPETEFPPDGRVAWGCEYDTYCVNPMVYCCFLLRRFVLAGGSIRKRELRSVEEVFSLSFPTSPPTSGEEEVKLKAVINASGYGLNHDPEMFITRGQTCLVAIPKNNEHINNTTITRQNADGTWSFSVPRGFDGGTVIGGTKEVGNWDPEPSVEMRERLLSGFFTTTAAAAAAAARKRPDMGIPLLGPDNGPNSLGRPNGERENENENEKRGNTKIEEEQQHSQYRILRDIVGRRPTRRGGPRIEAERITINTEKGEREKEKGLVVVIHAYGLGGRGFELSWGVAERVVSLLLSNEDCVGGGGGGDLFSDRNGDGGKGKRGGGGSEL
jgi:D-amino-acid oxidase